MTAAPAGQIHTVDPWMAAPELADDIAVGRKLPEFATPVPLEVGEVLHASVEARAWRYQALDVVYPQQRVIAVGGPVAFALNAAASAVGNRRARAEAERQAVPQWRYVGHLPVLATTHRLLVLHDGAWASVWYEAIRQVRPALAEGRLELVFEDDPPYALQGPWVPYLGVVLATILAERLGTDAVGVGSAAGLISV
jgi:hypothetical protein